VEYPVLNPFLRPVLVDGYTTQSVMHGRVSANLWLSQTFLANSTTTVHWRVLMSHPAKDRRPSWPGCLTIYP